MWIKWHWPLNTVICKLLTDNTLSTNQGLLSADDNSVATDEIITVRDLRDRKTADFRYSM